MAGYNEEEFNVCEGENGHMHDECLIEVLQERCGFEPGDVRVVILDAATGEFERGYVDVDDMIVNQPRADDLPVHVHRAV